MRRHCTDSRDWFLRQTMTMVPKTLACSTVTMVARFGPDREQRIAQRLRRLMKHSGVPRVLFVDEPQWGQRRGQAYLGTGCNVTTGELTLGVAMRKRRNGLVTFDA